MADDTRTDIPEKYRQRDAAFRGRIVRDSRELVTYTPSSHTRIWYNNQSEGYEIHSHDALEVFICIQNNYEIHANNKKYILSEGDILIIPPQMLHEYINDKYGIRFIYLIEMNSFFESHDFKTIEPFFFNAFLCNRETCPDIYNRVYNIFMEINTAYFTNVNFWETIIYSKMYQVFIEIARHVENTVKADTTNPSDSISRINDLLKYVDVNYANDISTDMAADITGFSKAHFMRVFKLQTGYTFHDYLLMKRIQIAEELLMTEMSITDISYQTGFNTPQSFSRAFKTVTNYSPSEYKNIRISTMETNHDKV